MCSDDHQVLCRNVCCFLQLLQLLVACFKACRKHFCRASGNSSLQLELAVLSLLQGITTHPVAAASR